MSDAEYMDKDKWEPKDFEQHILDNIESEYGLMVTNAALFRLLFGIMPKIGLSGFQGEAVEFIVSKFMEVPSE